MSNESEILESETAEASAAPRRTRAPRVENDRATVGEFAVEIASAIKGMQPKRQLTVAEVKPRTRFNPTGKRNRKLARPTFVNGRAAHANTHTLFDEEIALLNKLKPGRFLGGLVTVTERDLGPRGVAIYIWYPNRTHDQRMAIKGEARNFRELLKRCLDEATAGVAAA